MIRLHRAYITIPVIVAVEIYFFSRYNELGAEFHFWLHGLFGATLGLMGLALWRLFKRRLQGRMLGLEAGFVGHIFSAMPDIIFLMFGVLHMYWMDIFALHISLHFVPQPLLVQFVLFLLALVAYGLAGTGQRRWAFASIGLICALTLFAMLLRQPIPKNLNEINKERQFWMCPLIGVDLREHKDHSPAEHRQLIEHQH